jgi:hypothetical protein
MCCQVVVYGYNAYITVSQGPFVGVLAMIVIYKLTG